MLIHKYCHICMTEGRLVSCSVEVRDKEFYKLECSHGHIIPIASTQHKYALLGELAFNAIIDEYYMQAVGTLWTALERCYEWYLRVVFTDKQNNDLTQFNATWTLAQVQSERQYGMFLATYFREEMKPPPRLPTTKANNPNNLRNKVIHQGLIPEVEEVYIFADEIIKIVQHIREIVMSKYDNAQQVLSRFALQAARERLGLSGSDPIYTLQDNSFALHRDGKLLSSAREIVGYYQDVRESQRVSSALLDRVRPT